MKAAKRQPYMVSELLTRWGKGGDGDASKTFARKPLLQSLQADNEARGQRLDLQLPDLWLGQVSAPRAETGRARTRGAGVTKSEDRSVVSVCLDQPTVGVKPAIAV